MDIDHFRPVNESYGNRTGDEVLQRIADLIRAALRKEDMLVRYGGEEFLVMLPEVPGPGAVVVADVAPGVTVLGSPARPAHS